MTLKELTDVTRELRTKLHGAMIFNNQQKINEFTYKLSVNNSKIVDMLMDRLERIEKSDTASDSYGLTSSIGTNVKVPKYPSIDVHLNGTDVPE